MLLLLLCYVTSMARFVGEDTNKGESGIIRVFFGCAWVEIMVFINMNMIKLWNIYCQSETFVLLPDLSENT